MPNVLVRGVECDAILAANDAMAELTAMGVTHEFPSAWLPSTGALDLSRRALKEWLGALVGGC